MNRYKVEALLMLSMVFVILVGIIFTFIFKIIK